MEVTTDIPVKKKSNSLWIALGAAFKVALKSLKFVKIALAGASFAAYSYMFTWEFAAMLLLMIFIHELGHIWAMKRSGIKTKGIYLIPFVGGAAIAEEEFKSRKEEAFIAIMGPWFGFAISLIYLLGYYITDNPVFAAGCAWCCLINLVNLLPVNPLDGGRILKSLAFSIGNVWGIVFLSCGILAMIAMVIFFKVWFFLLLLFFAALELIFEVRNFRFKKQISELKLDTSKILKTILQQETKQIMSDDEIEYQYKTHRLNDLKILEEDVDKEIIKLQEEKDFIIKPPMTKKEFVFYTIAYALTCYIFFQAIMIVQDIPGCKEALEMLK